MGRWLGGFMPVQEGARKESASPDWQDLRLDLFYSWQHQGQNSALALSFLVPVIPVLFLPHCYN